jgi:hypothetical protein
VGKAKRPAEAETIIAALNSTHWNRKQPAALLKIDYKALLYDRLAAITPISKMHPFHPMRAAARADISGVEAPYAPRGVEWIADEEVFR